MWYLDGLLNEENSNQHAKELPCNPSEFCNDRAGIEYGKKK